MLELKRHEPAALRRILRRMHRVSTPLNEERHDIHVAFLETATDASAPPTQRYAIRPDPRPVTRTEYAEVCGARASHDAIEICRCRGPRDQLRRPETPDVDLEAEGGLRGIRSDDLEILATAEREQGVTRADARVASAHARSHTGLLLDVRNPLVEIGDSEQQMIDGLARSAIACRRHGPTHRTDRGDAGRPYEPLAPCHLRS